MKIGMFTRWNASCGVAVHSELVGREWVKHGHDLTVFAPSLESKWFDDKDSYVAVDVEDDQFVQRIYNEPTDSSDPGWVSERIWVEDYDVLVAQGLRILPMRAMVDEWNKAKAKKVHVWHEGYLLNQKLFYEFEFDSIVVFDDRYKHMLSELFSHNKIHVVPYPCHPIHAGDKTKAREKLGISIDVVVLFSFGTQLQQEYDDYLAITRELAHDHEIIYIIIRSDRKWEGEVPRFVNLQLRSPSLDEIYTYLHAADALLIPKPDTEEVVVSSTVFQCMGSLCPIVIPDVKYVETVDSGLIKFRNRKELKRMLTRLINDAKFRVELRRSAEVYVSRNSAPLVAHKLAEMFQCL